ncbi:conserved protein of unknown function (YtkA like domain 25-108) (plasmid) [Magnetospirillum sp. XM-1]|uniref:FixH family protein n=1 Tax=Magnetospirillum sp. XM-1 TaxID=1663591 RepID=UPI00073E00BD|nr:FixH family protein [Magnetospirillum sp. XM-1]CUW42000.1 conserved protein of unknown function (YtkA like domain 25-108) [Magnetospirillum sp. XM-1]
MRMKLMAMAGMVVVSLGAVSGPALADPKDYRFEAVDSQVTVSPTATMAVRLVHVPTGKVVTNAIVFQPKMEMPMGNMAPMPTKVVPSAPDGKGVYPFTADISMAGPLTLTVSAKIQGEATTVTGSVPFTAAAMDHGKTDNGGHNH